MKFPTQTDGARLEALIEEIEHQIVVNTRLLENNARLRHVLAQLTHTFVPLNKAPQFCASHRCTEPLDHPVHLTPELVLPR